MSVSPRSTTSFSHHYDVFSLFIFFSHNFLLFRHLFLPSLLLRWLQNCRHIKRIQYARVLNIHTKFMACISHLPTTSASVENQVILPYFDLMQVRVMSWFGVFLRCIFTVWEASWGNFQIKCTFHPFYYCFFTLLLSVRDDQKATDTKMVDERRKRWEAKRNAHIEAGRRVITNKPVVDEHQIKCAVHMHVAHARTRTPTLKLTPTPAQTNCTLHMCHFDGK